MIVENQLADAVDSSMYITTDQNFIRTKEGTQDIQLSMSLVGGLPGDENNFIWTLSDSSVLSLSTPHGTVKGKSLRSVGGKSKSLTMTRQGGTAYITALKPGLATISVSHPKVTVPTDVLVRVLPVGAVLEDPAYITGPSLIGIVRGTSEAVSVTLYGKSVVSTDAAGLSWEIENPTVATVLANGKDGTINAKASGSTYITILHPKAETPKKILVYVADTQEELDAYRLLYVRRRTILLLRGNPRTSICPL